MTRGQEIAEELVIGGYGTDGDPNSVYVQMPNNKWCLLYQPAGCSGSVGHVRDSFARAIDAARAEMRQACADEASSDEGCWCHDRLIGKCGYCRILELD